jgi:hypothetical protein
MMGGHTVLGDHTCIRVPFQTVTHNCFISLTIISICLAGSRAWSLSFGSTVYGLKEMPISLHSAQAFIVPLAALTVAVGKSFFHSPISCLRSSSFKSWLSLMATCVTFTPSIIVNSTLSNNTGKWQSSAFVWQSA